MPGSSTPVHVPIIRPSTAVKSWCATLLPSLTALARAFGLPRDIKAKGMRRYDASSPDRSTFLPVEAFRASAGRQRLQGPQRF